MTRDSAEYLIRAVEYGPAAASHTPDLRGWWTPAGWYVCAPHAARIMARGCSLPQGSTPVWRDEPEPVGVCCCCHPPEIV